MRERRDTKSLILNRGLELIQSKGYNGFSYQDIAKPLGIKNAAVHYHYATKAHLGMAVIERYRELLHTKTDDFMRNGGDPLPQLEGYFQFVQRECDLSRLCPIGVLATELSSVPSSMRALARSLVDETLAWLAKVLTTGRDRGVFHFQGTPSDKAVAVMSSLQGARELARLAGPELLEAATRQVRKDLGLQ